MADLEKTVAIIFEGVDQMGAGVTSATKQIDTLAGSVQQAAQPMADLTLGVLKFEGALLAAGAAVTTLAVKTAGDFDSSFREITTLIDLPAQALDQFRGDVLDYASGSTQAIGDVTGALYSLVSAGNDTEEALTLLANAEQLAVGGKTELSTAANGLAGVMNAYGAEASNAEQYTDAMFVAMKNGMTTIDELASSLPQVTGLASQLGVDFDTLVSAVSALTTTGLSTSQAVTQVGAALNSILGPSQQAKTLADELGIEFSATALEAKGLDGFLLDLAEATGGNAEQMNTLFGSTEATRAVLALIGPVAEQFGINLDDMGEKAGATATAFGKMVDDIDNGTTRIKNAMIGVLVGIGQPVLDEFSGIQEAIAGIFSAIGASIDDGQLNQFTALLESVFSDVEATLQDVAQNLPEALELADWSGFLNGIEAIRTAVSELFDGADLTTAEGLAQVITKLGTGFELLSEYTAGTITAIGPFIEQLADLAGWIMEIDPAWVAMMGTIGGSAVVLTTVLSAFSSFLNILNSLAGAKGAIPAVTGASSKLATALGTSSKVGLWGAALGAAYGVKQLYDRLDEFNSFKLTFSDELKEELDKTSGAQKAATEVSLFSVQKIAEAYVGLSDKFGWGDDAAADLKVVSEEAIEAAKAVVGLGDDAKDASGDLGDLAGAANPAAQEVAKIEQAAIEAAKAVAGLGEGEEEIKKLDTAAVDAALAVAKIGDNEAINVLSADIDDTSQYVRGLDGNLIDVNKTISTLGEVTKGAGNEADEGAKKFGEMEQAAMELASNEKIKAMEFSANIAVAEIEADAQKVEAIMSSLGKTIDNTSQLLGGLYSDRYGNDDLSRWDEVGLDSSIRKQEEAQQAAIKLQNELAKSQIENLKARTQALQSGEGLIKIDSTGLEPALEMIMWEIIEKVQMRANAEGAEFLLGLNSGGA